MTFNDLLQPMTEIWEIWVIFPKCGQHMGSMVNMEIMGNMGTYVY